MSAARSRLLVSVQLDEIVVREPTDAFGNTKSPGMRFVFGGRDANLLSVEPRRTSFATARA
jgi:hypothetical protein